MALPTPISVPKGYQRLGAFPLDASSVFATLAELESYAATNGTAYAGQVCAVSGTGKVYVIQSDFTLLELGERPRDTYFGPTPPDPSEYKIWVNTNVARVFYYVNGAWVENVGGSSSGGSAVDSVNGQEGVVILSAADVGAAPAVHPHTLGDLQQSGALEGQMPAWTQEGWKPKTSSYNDLADKPTLGTAAATDATAYATAAQGDKADTALQPAALTPYRTAEAQDALDAPSVLRPPTDYDSFTITRDSQGNVTSTAYLKAGSAFFTLTMTWNTSTTPNRVATVSDGTKTLTLSYDESGNVTGGTLS